MREVTRRGKTWNVEYPDDSNWFWGAWEADEWESDTLEILQEFITSGSTFVDIGAWIGPISMWAVECGATNILALEPDPSARNTLIRNFNANLEHRSPEVRYNIYPIAISDRNGIDHLAPHRGWGSSMSFLTLPDNPEAVPVPSLTIDRLWWTLNDPQNVSLVKMDIEGAESRVLESVSPFLAERGIPMVVSLHPQWYTKPFDPSWYAGYGTVLENMGVLQDMTILIP